MSEQTHLQVIQQSDGHAALEKAAVFGGVLNVANLSGVDRVMMTAKAIASIREALSVSVMKEWIIPLMNTSVGFDTDHNKNKGWNGQDYSLATVRECCIEAILHGLPLVGNAWNIIADRMYVRKEGFEGLIRGRVRMSSSVKIDPVEAKNAADQQGGGYCKALVVLQYKRPEADQMDPFEVFKGSYQVRVNARNKVPVEASEGKALRKGYRDLWHLLTGALVPEGDTGDVLEIDPAAANGDPTTNGMTPEPDDPSPVAPPKGGNDKKAAPPSAPSTPDLDLSPPLGAPAGPMARHPPVVPSIDELRDVLKIEKVTADEVAKTMGIEVTGRVMAAKDFPEDRREEAIDAAQRIALSR